METSVIIIHPVSEKFSWNLISVLYPYGFAKEAHPRVNELHAVAEAGALAVYDATGSVFVPGQSGEILINFIK